MDTVGNVIDKLLTVNLKTAYNEIHNQHDALDDLKRQRELLISEINQLIDKLRTGEIDKNSIVMPQHKTY